MQNYVGHVCKLMYTSMGLACAHIFVCLCLCVSMCGGWYEGQAVVVCLFTVLMEWFFFFFFWFYFDS